MLIPYIHKRNQLYNNNNNVNNNNNNIIIMLVYHALINTLSAHVIHINLNTIFCTHVEHSPIESVYIKY